MFFGKDMLFRQFLQLRQSRFRRKSLSAVVRSEVLEVRCLLSTAQPVSPSGANASSLSNEWDTYQGNPAHTGYVPGAYDFTNASIQWQTTVSTNAVEGLAVGGGTVLATNYTRFENITSMYALNQDTGTILWSKAYGSNNDSTSPPAYANGVAYVQTDGNSVNNLSAYNVNTGALVFQAPYSAQWETYLNPTPYGGNVYVGGGEYGGMYSFGATSGAQKWFGSVPQYDGWTPAVDGNYAYAYTGSGDTTPITGVFTMINLATGATAASIVDPVYNWTGYTMNSAVVLGSQHDAFTINGNRLVSWDTTLDATHTPHIAWSLTDGYSGQPTLANGYLYVINHGQLNALNETTGQLVWSWAAPSGNLTGPMIATDNGIFVQTSTTTTYAIDLTSHKSTWSSPISGTMAFSGGTLYVGDSNGVVYAITKHAPLTLSGIGATQAFVKGSAPLPIASSLSLVDSAGLQISSATVTVTNWQPEDRLAFWNKFALTNTLAINGNTATLTITGNAPVAAYFATLQSLTFQDLNSNTPVLTARTFVISVTDTASDSTSALGNVIVQNVDLPPVLTAIETTPLAYTAGGSPVTISSTLLANDPDSMNLSHATVQITSGYQNDAGGHDILSFVNQYGITGSFDAVTGTLTLMGDSYVGNYRAALRSVLFSTSGTAISTSTRALTITGTDDSSPTPATSVPITRNVSVTALPTLSDYVGTATFVKGSAPMAVAPNLVISDASTANITGATVTITNWQSEDRLSFYHSAALLSTLVISANTATLTLRGSAMAAAYQTVLRSVAFHDLNSNVPNTSARGVSILVTDGSSTSNTLMGSIVVQNVNLPPVVFGIETGPLTYAANHPEVPPQAISSSVQVIDPDSNNLTKVTVQITTGYQNNGNDQDLLSFVNAYGITGSFDPSSGTLTLSGTSYVGNYRAALQSVVFSTSGPAISTATRTLTILATDNVTPIPATSAPITRNVTVTTTNAAPSLSGGAGAAIFVKGSAAIPLAPNLVVADTDSANLASATVTITNWLPEDRLVFNNLFALQHSFNVDTSTKTATLSITGAESSAHYQAALNSITYQDVNSNVPSFMERPVSITVSDGYAQSNTVAIIIAVQNVNLPPVAYGIETTSLAYASNGVGVAISSTLLVIDPDSNNLTKATVQITSGYQHNAGGQDVLSFVNKYGITGSFDASSGTLTLSGPSYVGNYRAALRSILFAATGTMVSTATRTLTITVFDDANAQSIPIIRNVTVS